MSLLTDLLTRERQLLNQINWGLFSCAAELDVVRDELTATMDKIAALTNTENNAQEECND